MFNRLAKLDAGRRHMVPEVARVHYPLIHNDNRPGCRLAAVAARPQRLTCHWRVAAADGRLECHWQVEPADETAADADLRESERLYAALGQATPASCPRTFKLLDSSTRKISQKVIEEAGEVALEAVKHHAYGVVRESADLLYHLVVLRRRAGVEPTEVWKEMRARADAFGIAEKLPKTLGRKEAVADPNHSTLNEQEGKGS